MKVLLKYLKRNVQKKVQKVYPSITIIFVDKYLSLAQLISKKLNYTLNKASGNYYVLSVYNKSALYFVASLLNGKYIIPKIEALHNFIILLNNLEEFPILELFPVDNSDLKTNYWLAWFSDSDAKYFKFILQLNIL